MGFFPSHCNDGIYQIFVKEHNPRKVVSYGVVPTFSANLSNKIALKQRSKNEFQPVTNNPQHAQAVKTRG
jgi:hypothetical protein